MTKKKETFREELGEFEKKISRAIPKKKIKDKFLSYYNKLSPERRFQVRKYAETIGLPAFAMSVMGFMGILPILIAPVGVASGVAGLMDVRLAEQKLKDDKSKKKLKKVI